MKIKVIYGASCSGKSTYAREHIGEKDIVYDYDQLSRALTYGEEHTLTRQQAHDFVVDFRLNILKRIKADKDEREGVCFFLVTNLTDQFLNFISDCDYEVIEMDVTKEECLERLENDDTRPNKEEWKEKIEEWYKKKEEKEEGEKVKQENSSKTNREYRSVVELRANAEENYIVEGYATTFNTPYELYSYGHYKVMERISPNAFDECDMSDVIMQYDHEGRVFARTRNKTLELSVDSKGLFVRANLGGTEQGRSLFEDIKGGYIDRMSFGFIVAEDEKTYTEDYDNDTETCLRTITKIRKLYDVSAVSIPANDSTTISARKFSDGVIAELETDRLKRAKLKLKLKLSQGD